MSNPSKGATSTNQPSSNSSLGVSALNDAEAARFRRDQWPSNQPSGPNSAPPTHAHRLPDRSSVPARASTTGSTPDADPGFAILSIPYARSEDLNHTSGPYSRNAGASGSSPNSSATRPITPVSSEQHSNQLTPSKSERRKSAGSATSSSTSASDSMQPPPPASSTSVSSFSASSTTCSACNRSMQGAFVRALGTVFHLNCFSCLDCGDLVASKFFPIDGSDGKQQPLCEKDYFRRLNLICAKCDQALRGSYITACNKKYHVEHFTCSICPTLFGPQDSYYEHENDVYCHFHYSTRFATKCVGCNSAILKQFVEINRNMRDECWHPECYMINKFWNVKVVNRRSPSTTGSELESATPVYLDEEGSETAATLKEKQAGMEQQVYRIWTVLSAFEESSAACISDMLRQVSNGQYLDAIRMAEKFILHVEVLFATIDDLEYHHARLNLKGPAHIREARMLCRKTVDLFTLLSHTQETGARRMGMTQELLALVTGLAHYLKILIRIALTGALKLEREQNVSEAMSSFLDKLHLLAVQGGNPSARRLLKNSSGEVVASTHAGNICTQGVTYGFRSLAPEHAGDSPFFSSPHGTNSRDGNYPGKVSTSRPPSDLCVKCGLTVEEECVRLGTYQRWHSYCVQCGVCGKLAALPWSKEKDKEKGKEKEKEKEKDKDKDKDKAMEEKDKAGEKNDGVKLTTGRRPPPDVGLFVYDPESKKDTTSFGDVPTVILCTDHAHTGCRGGFQAVSRLEQYAFLLNVALRRLYLLLKKQGVVPLSPVSTTTAGQQTQKGNESNPYRNSADIMRMKSVHLDRKLSSTARLPKRSTIVESPTGKSIQESDVVHSSRSHEAGSQRTAQSRPPLPAMPTPPRTPVARPPESAGSQVIRPPFARNITEVMIVDDVAPTPPPPGDKDEPQSSPRPTSVLDDDGITLADIPQIAEAAQAREQHRSLPRESSIPYIADLSALELAIVKHAAVLALHRSPLRDQFELEEILELLEVKKSGFFFKLFKSGNEKKNVKKKGVFGVPLELLVEREGADSLLGVTRSTLRVPSFIDDVISAMRQMDMSVEGIFRKNGNIRRLKDLTEAIDRDPSSVDLTQDNPVQLAALLKKFLRDLPDPLMTYKLHKLFIASQSVLQEAERMRLLHMVSIILPKAHRDTMEVLFVFLKWVASFAHMDEETGSKMDLGNLATVICPSILYARGRDAVRDDSFSAIRVITVLLEHQDEFFQVPAEFLPILNDQEYFSNSLELPSKDFLRKCDTYMRLKTNGRAPAITTPSNSAYSVNAPYQARVHQPSSQTSERATVNASTSESSSRGAARQPQPGVVSPSPSYSTQGAQRSDQEWSNSTSPRPPAMSPQLRPASWMQNRVEDQTQPQQQVVQNGHRPERPQQQQR